MDVDGEDLQTLTDRDQAPWGLIAIEIPPAPLEGLFGLLAPTTNRGQNGTLGRNVAVIGHAIRIGKRVFLRTRSGAYVGGFYRVGKRIGIEGISIERDQLAGVIFLTEHLCVTVRRAADGID